ncbi:MAG: FtsX-like permease family protein, partial [Candidatus Latescibacteria bacterium]|nr:FtsX-like permease family protein [Candidatus Latescibacterota bacterium]
MLKSYIALMIRNLRKQFGYTLINISGLAIGMSCCVLIFLYVQDELRFDAHGNVSSQVFRVANGAMASGPSSLGPVLKSEYPEVLEYARVKPPFGVWLMRFGDQVFYEKRVYWADASVFEMFSWSLVKGDPGTALSKPNTVVISQEMVAKYFPGQDPMGRILSADDDFLHLEVTGVMDDIPANSHFIADILFSTATMPSLYGTGVLDDWSRTDFYTYILLSTGTSADELQLKFPALVSGYQREGSESLALNPSLQAIGDIHLHSDLDNELGTNSDVSYVYILSSIGFFMLLLACINFMNLATARSAMRAREVGLRKVLGAHRGELIKQFMGETVLMSVVSLIVSLILVSLIMPTFNIFAAKNLSLGLDNVALYLSLVGIVLFVGVVAGIYPAFVLSSFQPGAVLKDSMKIGGAGAMLRKSLVVFQFVIATAFIVGTSVVYDQLSYIQAKRLGFDKEHVITVPAAISPILQRLDLFAKGLEADSRIIGVTSSSSLPGRSGGTGILQRVPVRPEGHAAEKPIQISGLWA